MTLLGGLAVEHESAADDRPHWVGYTTPRGTANDTLFEVRNGVATTTRKFVVDLDGKLYSDALTAGDLLYAVAGGVTSVRRLDSLAIGTADQVLQVNAGATAPEWGQVATAGLADSAVTYAKVQDVSATSRLLGRVTAGAGVVEELTATGGLEFSGAGLRTAAFTGDVTKSAGGTALTIAAEAVTYAKFQNLDALSVFGRSVNSGGAGASIAAGTDKQVLRRSGTTLGFGAVDLASSDAVTGVLPTGNIASTLTSKTLSSPTLSGTVSGTPTWASTQSLNTSGNAATATALETARTINGVSFDGTGNITVTAAAGTLTGSTLAAGVTASSLTSVGTLTSLTLSGLLLTVASAAGGAGFRLPHGSAPSAPTDGDVWSTTGGLFARINGATQQMSVVGHAHAASDVTSGTFADARVAESNVTQHEAALTIGAAQLTGTIASARISGAYTGVTQVGTLTAGELGAGFTTVAVARGGTGLSTFTAAGRLVYSTAATTLAGLAIGTANQVLQVNSGATAPEWTSTITSPTLAGTVSGTPTWGSNQAITLSTAAQPNVTSLGTLTSLVVSGVLSGSFATVSDTGTQDDYDLGTKTLVRATNGSTLDITGIVAGNDGDIYILFVAGAGNVALRDEDAGSVAANRIIVPGGTVTMNADESAILIYDGTSSRWRALLTNVANAGDLG